MNEKVKNELLEAREILSAMLGDAALLETIARAGAVLAEAFRHGGKVYSCGNGGSMCDAMHFSEELSGRYRNERPALPATAISDVGHMTCVANDYGYEYVFSRYIEAHGRPGDVLLAISTSGRSKSVLNAATEAKKKGVTVIALNGLMNSPLSQLADLDICIQAKGYADRVQECHIKVIHILIHLVEESLFQKD